MFLFNISKVLSNLWVMDKFYFLVRESCDMIIDIVV